MFPSKKNAILILFTVLSCILGANQAYPKSASSPNTQALNPGDKACAEKSDQGEDLREAGKKDQAHKVLLEAVRLCADSSVRGARPFIALGKSFYEQDKFNDAIRYFEMALKKEPGLSLAYMNLGASYIGLEQYDKAIDVLKSGLLNAQGDPDMLGKINFNIGLSYLKRADQQNKLPDTMGEAYFKKSQSYLPDYGSTYYYLGSYAYDLHHNMAEAKALFKKACNLGDDLGCGQYAKMGGN